MIWEWLQKWALAFRQAAHSFFHVRCHGETAQRRHSARDEGAMRRREHPDSVPTSRHSRDAFAPRLRSGSQYLIYSTDSHGIDVWHDATDMPSYLLAPLAVTTLALGHLHTKAQADTPLSPLIKLRILGAPPGPVTSQVFLLRVSSSYTNQ